MDFITYLLFRFFILIFRVIPFSWLYALADLVSWLIYHLFGYRKKVVYQNLRNAFPSMSEEDRRRIAISFYHHLADMLIESLKSFNMTEREIVKRYRFTNTAFIDELYKSGRSAICVAGHYGNWEWGGIAAGTQLLHKPVGFYKPLSNKYIDRFVQKTRVQGRSKLVSITDTAEVFKTDYQEPVLFYMVADQSPSSARLAFWVDFLNQDTAVLHGPEKYARIYNMPVIFAYPRKLKRGCYEVSFEMLEPDPGQTKTGGITRRYMEMLEEVILKDPRYYLWSHRRWKLKR